MLEATPTTVSDEVTTDEPPEAAPSWQEQAVSNHKSALALQTVTTSRGVCVLAALSSWLLMGCLEDAPPASPPGICDEGGGDDPYGSDEPRMEGDNLQLSVGYGGGCGHHDFAPCWEGTFAASGDLLVAALRVGHDAHGDNCELGISTGVELDLGEIAEAWRSETGLESGALLLRVTLHRWEGAEPPTEDETIEWTLE